VAPVDVPIVPQEFAAGLDAPVVIVVLEPLPTSRPRGDASFYLVRPDSRATREPRDHLASADLREILDEAQHLARSAGAAAIAIERH